MKRLLVVRLGSLGDLVHTLPAIASIRQAHSGLEIDWLVDSVHQDFLSLTPIVTSIVVLPDRTARGWWQVRPVLAARSYDVAADFQGLIKSAALARLSGARRVIGFDRESLREPAAGFFYTEQVDVRGAGHVIAKNLRLAAALGASGDSDLTFPLNDVESPALEDVRRKVSGPFAILNPGAAWPNKRWPTERFASVAVHLRDRHRLQSVVLWGPGEAGLADDVVQAAGGAAIAAPPTSLSDLVALARAARVMVSGDTGPVHIAAAVGLPVVALFGPTDPARNGPWAEADVSIARYAACECHYERRCRRDAGWCLLTITVEDVIAAVDRRFDAGESRP